MNACFADTFFFIALLFENDEAHAQARDLASKVPGRIYTSTWVLMELADAMATPANRERFAPFLQFHGSSPSVTVVPPDQVLFDRSVEMYHLHRDKAWSLTDCMFFIIMRDHQLSEALTADHHFEQAGFTALMK